VNRNKFPGQIRRGGDQLVDGKMAIRKMLKRVADVL